MRGVIHEISLNTFVNYSICCQCMCNRNLTRGNESMKGDNVTVIDGSQTRLNHAQTVRRLALAAQLCAYGIKVLDNNKSSAEITKTELLQKATEYKEKAERYYQRIHQYNDIKETTGLKKHSMMQIKPLKRQMHYF